MLDEAKKLIFYMKNGRPTCEECARVDARLFLVPPDENEWEYVHVCDFYLKRCARCASTAKYPWAGNLDGEVLAKHLETKPRVFDLAELEALIRSPVSK